MNTFHSKKDEKKEKFNKNSVLKFQKSEKKLQKKKKSEKIEEDLRDYTIYIRVGWDSISISPFYSSSFLEVNLNWPRNYREKDHFLVWFDRTTAQKPKIEGL